jgi:CubicO group peptidase (beta-lactamase class C family)
MRVRCRRIPPLVVLLLAALVGTARPQATAGRIDAIVQRYSREGLFQGSVLVADHGKVIYRKAVGLANAEWNVPNTVDTKFRIGSITKQFTAMLILQLLDEGKLRLDGTLGDYLPEYPEGPGRAVTIHQLLTHSSGIPSYTSNPKFFPEESRNPATPTEFIKRFWSLPLDFEPGTRFQYNNSGYFLLGVIIERLTGLSYPDALQQRILTPLGLRNTGYDWSTPLMPRRAGAYSVGLDGPENAPEPCTPRWRTSGHGTRL